MKISTRYFYSFCLWLALGSTSLISHADIVSLCDTSSPCSSAGLATAGIDSPVSVTWRGQMRNSTAAPTTETISSQRGRFIAISGQNNTVLGSTTTNLNQVVAPIRNAPSNFVFNEAVVVPGAISQQAAAMGLLQISYERSFASTVGRVVSGLVTIQLQAAPRPPTTQPPPTPPPGSQPPAPPQLGFVTTSLDINRIALRFDNDRQARLLNSGEPLNAKADINYESSGLLIAVWELATPASTNGQAIFQPLQNVRQYLGAGHRVILQSPNLPTDTHGLYLLRLRVLQPQYNFELVTLSYTVGDVSNSGPSQLGQKQVKEIQIAKPSQSARLSKDTEFSWQAVMGASAYQLELYDRPILSLTNLPLDTPTPSHTNSVKAQQDVPLITGAMIPANRAAMPISALTRSHLQSGHRYYWRVIAISERGEILAASATREIRIP